MKDIIEKSLSVAAESSLPIKIIYQGSSGITQRVIEIKRLNKDTLVAYCRLRRRISTFKIDCILAAEIIYNDKK